jgi:hypothetical protein
MGNMSVGKGGKRIVVTADPKITAWSVFVEEMKPQIMKTKGEISKQQLFEELRAEWNQQNEGERSGYENQAEKKTIIAKRHRKQPQFTNLSDSHRKTKQISGYSLFVADKQIDVKITHLNYTLSERTKIVSQHWRTLSENEKYFYQNKAKCENRNQRKVTSDREDCSSFKVGTKRKTPICGTAVKSQSEEQDEENKENEEQKIDD